MDEMNRIRNEISRLEEVRHSFCAQKNSRSLFYTYLTEYFALVLLRYSPMLNY